MEKITGKYLRTAITDSGIELTFKVNRKPIIEKDKEYEITVREYKDNRSKRQNDKLWAIINDICMKQDGNLRNADDLYLQLLEMAGAKHLIVSIPYEARKDLLKVVRSIKTLDVFTEDGVTYATVCLFYGSSSMNTKEMGNLIETAINYAYELGVDTEKYEERIS